MGSGEEVERKGLRGNVSKGSEEGVERTEEK